MRWMPMREFLRGGYKDLTETTVVSNHGRPVFTVFPYGTLERRVGFGLVDAVVESDPPSYEYVEHKRDPSTK